MSKLYFRKNGLQTTIIPSIDDGVNHLTTAINNLGAINIPNSFQYKAELESMKTDLESIKTSLTSDKDLINFGISKITPMSNTQEQVAYALPVTPINKRANFL